MILFFIVKTELSAFLPILIAVSLIILGIWIGWILDRIYLVYRLKKYGYSLDLIFSKKKSKDLSELLDELREK